MRSLACGRTDICSGLDGDEWPEAHLLIDPAHILADDAEKDRIEADAEQHEDDEGRKAARPGMTKPESLEKVEERKQEHENRNRQAGIGGEAQRQHRMSDNAVEREAHQLADRKLAAPMQPRC